MMKTDLNSIKATSENMLDDFNDFSRQPAGIGGKGVPMRKWKPFTDFVLSKLVKKAEIINGKALLPSDGRPVIAIASHGPGFAWVPLAALVGKFFIDSGHGNIIGGMYPHKAMFLIPGLKKFYQSVLGTPTEVNTVNDIVALLKNNEIGLTGTAPEGANCLLSFNEYVAPFRSKGMIAAAIKANTSICLMAHQGAEDWSFRINLPFGWTLPLTNGLRGFNITPPPFRKISRYTVLCRRYTPSITSADLENKSKREARLLLNIEIERIRAEMNLMTDEVKEMIIKETHKLRLATLPKKQSRSTKRQNFQSRIFPSDEAYMCS